MFTIYSKPNCPYCDQAKALLTSKHQAYQEKKIDVGQEKIEGDIYVTIQELKELVPHVKSVPQIFFDGNLIGGFQQLKFYLHN